MKKLFQSVVFLFLGISLFAQSSDKIFYSSFRPEGWNIYLSKDGGETFSEFTNHESLDYDAKISPDGQWVVFTSERLGKPHLFIKHVEGDSLPRLLVKSESMQDQVDFSPDGNWMVFLSTHEGNADIYKLPFIPNDTLDIAEAQNLTNNPGGDFRPKYSNDGSKIAFSSDRDHETKPHQFFPFAMQRTGDIYTMSSDGGAANRLTNSDFWEGSPAWSENDDEIFFYNGKDDILTLSSMSANGDGEESLFDFGFDCLSPSIGPKGHLLFTAIDYDADVFSILTLNLETTKIDSSLVQDMDMLNANYHPNGLLVFHGGKKPGDLEENMSGFEGGLLVKNNPEKRILDDRQIDLFGVRRAFAAPPTANGREIVYDFLPGEGFSDAMTPFVYPLAVIPILTLFWFLFGVITSIKMKKVIRSWKYLVFSLMALIVPALLAALFFHTFAELQWPLNEVKWVLLIFTLALLLSIIFFSVHYKKQKANRSADMGLYKNYDWMLFGNVLAAIYLIIFCGSFFSIKPEFYSVDYTTKEVTKLFTFEPDPNTNPFLSRVIDTKFTPDGEYLQFTVGGFRAEPKDQGVIYKYHIKEKSLERVSVMDSNNGFADFTKDNSSMVFRSGMTGNMDVYLREGDELINLTNSPDKENFPIISHDGNKIAFCSDVNGADKSGIVKTVDIYLSERQEDNTWSQPKQITTYSGQEGHPHFSPDGEWLIYSSEEFGINDEQPLVQTYIFSPQLYGEITAVRLEDGKKVRLTHNKWEDGAPLWISTEEAIAANN